MKRSVRKRADRVIMKGVEVMYKKKNSAEVRMIQSREEQIRVLEVRHSAPTSWHFGVKKTFNRVKYVEVLLERDVQRCRVIWVIGQNDTYRVLYAPNGTTKVACCLYY